MKNSTKVVLIILFLPVTFIFVFAFSLPQKIENRDSVRIVHNEKIGKWGKEPPVSLRLLRTIGNLYAEDENFAFYAPYDIALDAEGNMYIVDNGNFRIQKFSPEGRYLATIGRRGQGPAEFESPISIDIDSKGYIYIADTPNRKIHILTPEGKAYKTLIITKYHVVKARCLKPGLIAIGGITGLAWVYANDKNLPKLIKVFDLEGNLKYEFGEMFDYKDNLTSNWGNWFDYDVDPDGYLYLSFERRNCIEKYSPEGKLIWRADRVLNYETGVLEKGFIKISKKSRGVAMPKMNQVSHGIAVDEKGKSWVITLNRQLTEKEGGMVSLGAAGRRTISEPEKEKIELHKLEVFDTDGILLGEIQLNHHAHGIRIYGNYLFIWERNFTKYYQYEIIEK